MKAKKIILWTISIVALFFIFVAIFDKEETQPSTVEINPTIMQIWDQHRLAKVPEIAESWSNPVYLEVSDQNWGDSIFVTRDGQEIYFMYYPGDLITDLSTNSVGNPFEGWNADIYKSTSPFIAKEKDSRFYWNEDPWSAWSPSRDIDGNWFYASNRQDEEYKDNENDVFRNNERLAFNTEEGHDNAHYCKEKDELWMNRGKDLEIVVLKNAAANNFDGSVVLAPSPINDPNAKDMAPFLTDDCNTIYFASDRENGLDLTIYKSERTGENSWDYLEEVIGGQVTVSEPTLTSDGKRLFFEQAYQDEELGYNSLFFYIEKL